MTQDDDADELEDFGEAVGRSFEDKFLLSLIDAYPKPGSASEAARRRQREQRLRDAKTALFAADDLPGRPVEPDERALRWMGDQFNIDRVKVAITKDGTHRLAQPGFKARSIRKLAILAAEKFGAGGHDESQRLRAKYSSRWADIARYHDDVPETQEAAALEMIAEVLARHGLSMKPAVLG